jgi:hypothetical protein
MNKKTEIVEFDFRSKAFDILPGTDEYYCNNHNLKIYQNYSFYTDVGTISDNVHIKDICVEENIFFKYQIVKPKNVCKTKEIVFLFHGFNEKDWDKYIPWANSICEETGKSVVLFPLAFHMQRAPSNWSAKRNMYVLSEKRKRKYPNIINSTLSNVAISMRLHSMPQRFIWSGLQTYYDVVQFIEDCKKGEHDFIDMNFKYDIFSYSIGGFLGLILKFANYKEYFSNSKICLFCSGATFNRLSPVSKFILDSEANVALYSFLVEHLDSFLKKDHRLNHYLNGDHIEGGVFYSMLDYQKGRVFREAFFRKYEEEIYAITLKKDSVIPSFEVVNTLQGAYRDIGIKVEEIDFDREYTHENPFPLNSMSVPQIQEEYEGLFSRIADFLKG